MQLQMGLEHMGKPVLDKFNQRRSTNKFHYVNDYGKCHKRSLMTSHERAIPFLALPSGSTTDLNYEMTVRARTHTHKHTHTNFNQAVSGHILSLDELEGLLEVKRSCVLSRHHVSAC